MKTKRVLESKSFKFAYELTNFVRENEIKQEDIQSIHVLENAVWKNILFYWKEEASF